MTKKKNLGKVLGKSWIVSYLLASCFCYSSRRTQAERQFKTDVAEFRLEISANPVALRGRAIDTTPQHAAQCQKARTASAPPVDVWQFIQTPPGGFYGLVLSSGAGSSTRPALHVTACRETWSEDIWQYTDCFLLSSIIFTSFLEILDSIFSKNFSYMFSWNVPDPNPATLTS